MFNYVQESQRVKQALREAYPYEVVATEPAYDGHLHVKVVSERFNGKQENEKQDTIWNDLREKLGSHAEIVSLAIVYGTNEL